MLPGETVSTGAKLERCEDCGERPKLQVCHSQAGYYIGYKCSCSPFSRESGYYKKREDAEKELKNHSYFRDNTDVLVR